MKFDNNIILTLLFLIIASACNGNKTINNKVKYNIDLDSADKLDSLFLSHYFDTLEIIKLESSNEESLIGEITKMKMYNNMFFVLDRRISKGLFAYDRKGNFIKRIVRIGNGPDEFLNITDFVVDEDRKELYILDNRLKKIRCYDILSWNIKRELILRDDYNINYLAIWQNQLYSDCSSLQNSMKNNMVQEISSETGKHIQRYSLDFMTYELTPTDVNVVVPNFFYQANDGLYLTQQFSPIIALLNDKGVNPLFKVESSDFISQDDLEKLQGKKHMEANDALLKIGKLYNINQLKCFNNWISFKIQKGMDVRTVIYNMHSNETQVIKLFVNDLMYQKHLPFLGFYNYGDISKDGISFYLNPMTVGLMEKFSNKRNIGEALERLKAFWNEDDNPHILYFKFKK